MVLPVKVSIGKITFLAYTVDVSNNGARIGGLRTHLQLGMIVSLQRGSHKARLRIAWVWELAPNELQAGVECVEPRSNFWGVDLSDCENTVREDMQALMTLVTSNVRRSGKT